MINLYVSSSIKGCIDYEQFIARVGPINVVEEYSLHDVVSSFQNNEKNIFQFRLRYTVLYFLFFFSSRHYLDFRTLSVSSNVYVRKFTNSIIKFFLNKFDRSIADQTAYHYTNTSSKITFGLGTMAKKAKLNFVKSEKIRFVFIGSINRVNFEQVRELFQSNKLEGSSLDIFAGQAPSQNIMNALAEIFDHINVHEWCDYDDLQERLSNYDIGLNYVDPDIYRTQLPLKILDYAGAGIYTLTNPTQAIEDYIPDNIYITTIADIPKLVARGSVKFRPPFGDWNSQVKSLSEVLET